MSSKGRVFDQPVRANSELGTGGSLPCFGMAHKLAGRYAGRGEPLEELVQVAMLGLVQVARRFDPARGSSSSSFAVPTVLGEIRRYFRDQCWAVRVPRPVHDLHLEIQRVQEYLTVELQLAPTAHELAAKLNAPRRRSSRVRRVACPIPRCR